MVTASHNDNGWTGIKMGIERPLTFGPEDMSALKEIVLGGNVEIAGRRRYIFLPDMAERYIGRPLEAKEARPQDESGSGLRQRHGGRLCAARPRRARRAMSSRSTACSTTPSRLTIPTPKTWTCCTPSGCRALPWRRSWASASTATATAAASSTTKATRSSPTRSASCSRAIFRAGTNLRCFVADVKSTGLFLTDPVLKANGAEPRSLEDRPLLYQALQPSRPARWSASRSPGTSSSIRPSAAAMTTASSRPSPFCDMLDRAPGKSLPGARRGLRHVHRHLRRRCLGAVPEGDPALGGLLGSACPRHPRAVRRQPVHLRRRHPGHRGRGSGLRAGRGPGLRRSPGRPADRGVRRRLGRGRDRRPDRPGHDRGGLSPRRRPPAGSTCSTVPACSPAT